MAKRIIMATNNSKPVYKDFQTFYTEAVLPLKKANHASIRLDGKLKGNTRIDCGYFLYQDKKWRVAADTHIVKLDLAFEEFNKGNDPFVIKATRDHKGETLSIKGDPIRNARFYVYSA
ncbi:MAG: hypothetical protein JWQ28_396 [Pedobacter sp.]|nr:hypothetical protein [Pedobacter sp.]